MFFNTFLLRCWQRVIASISYVLFTSVVLSSMVFASPGAHGPNGEHLDTSNSVLASVNPKFESFTESFELLGELFESQLIIYLHDFKTNVPVEGASIELESGQLSASTEYSDTLKAYLLTDQKMLKLLNTEGNHEVVLTVMTQDSGDLLVANFNITKAQTNEHHDEEHHHIPWFEIFVAFVVFCVGFVFGRINKEKKS